jgi:hypothetical protein
MIWSTTTHVGMAFAISPSGATYVVARYSPPGNILGESPQQDTTRCRDNNTSDNVFPPYARVPKSKRSGNAQRSHSRYGHNPHLGLQHRYNGRRAHESMSGNNNNNNNNEGPLPSPRYPFGRPPPSSRRMPVSHTDPFRVPYGSSHLYSGGPQASRPYGVGAHGPYASARTPVGYGGHRSRGSSASLCCTVM